MRKGILTGVILMVCFYTASAQYGGRYGRSREYRRERFRELQNFKPSLDVSIGYGFPNLDKYLLADFQDYYSGSTSQSGPVIASIDYRFAPRMAIGVMVNYGKISRPYYNYYTGEQEFTGSINNTAVLLNFTQYMGASTKILPYTRTAIGFNTGKSKYLDSDGNKVTDTDDATTLAYQVALGVQLNVTKRGGFFVEAGYGKYIVAGGLKMRF